MCIWKEITGQMHVVCSSDSSPGLMWWKALTRCLPGPCRTDFWRENRWNVGICVAGRFQEKQLTHLDLDSSVAGQEITNQMSSFPLQNRSARNCLPYFLDCSWHKQLSDFLVIVLRLICIFFKNNPFGCCKWLILPSFLNNENEN